MANQKLLFGLGAGGIVILALAMFTSGDDRKPTKQPQSTHKVAVKKDQVKKLSPAERKKRAEARKAKRRAAMVKRWNKMTPEQRAEFMKKHPNFKPPADKPAAGTVGTKSPGATSVTTKSKQPVSTTKTQPAKPVVTPATKPATTTTTKPKTTN